MTKQKDTKENKKNTENTETRSESINVEAKTVQEAIKQALSILNAKEDEVKIKVLKEEHKGLFGMEGAGKAKIKATLTRKA